MMRSRASSERKGGLEGRGEKKGRGSTLNTHVSKLQKIDVGGRGNIGPRPNKQRTKRGLTKGKRVNPPQLGTSTRGDKKRREGSSLNQGIVLGATDAKGKKRRRRVDRRGGRRTLKAHETKGGVKEHNCVS